MTKNTKKKEHKKKKTWKKIHERSSSCPPPSSPLPYALPPPSAHVNIVTFCSAP